MYPDFNLVKICRPYLNKIKGKQESYDYLFKKFKKNIFYVTNKNTDFLIMQNNNSIIERPLTSSERHLFNQDKKPYFRLRPKKNKIVFFYDKSDNPKENKSKIINVDNIAIEFKKGNNFLVLTADSRKDFIDFTINDNGHQKIYRLKSLELEGLPVN